MMIIADKFEPPKLRQIADEVRELGFDYLVIGSERVYVIERKEIGDAVGSVRSKRGTIRERMWMQIKRIKKIAEEYENGYPIVILEGNHFRKFRSKYFKLTPAQWYGMQTKIVEMGVGLIRTWSMRETIGFLKNLDKRAGKEVDDVVTLSFSKTLREPKDESMHVLMAITNVGAKTAKRLLREFGSPIAVFQADEKELARIVGEKLAKHIKEVVEYRW